MGEEDFISVQNLVQINNCLLLRSPKAIFLKNWKGRRPSINIHLNYFQNIVVFYFNKDIPEFSLSFRKQGAEMNMQSTKLELIKLIADIQSEELLDRVRLFLKEVESEMKASDKPPALSKEETELLLKINEGLPEEVQLRYNELLIKQSEETITDEEHEELVQLIPRVEAKSVERMKYLIQLAQLWNISVDEVMERLGIKPPPVIHA